MNTDRDREDYERWQRYGRDRGWVEKMGDKVRSWFGDEDAERRRRMDESQERSSQFREGRSTSYDSPQGPYPQQAQHYTSRPGNYGSVEYMRPSGHPDYFGEHDQWDQGRSDWYGTRGSREEQGRWHPGMHREERYTPYASRFYGGQSGETFAGRGPRGYQRNDERIKDDVCERLTMHPEVDATEIEVIVQNGDVTLTGVVHSRWEKRRAEEIAEDVYGVNNVHNNLRMGTLGESSQGSLTRPTEDKILHRPR